MSEISRLSFSLEPWERNNGIVFRVVPCINGIALTKLIEVFEREHSFQKVGGYGGIIPQHFKLGPLDRYFLGLFDPGSYWALEGGIELLSCECGEFGCWPLLGRVVVGENRIQWTRFAQPHRPKQDYSEFGPFQFDAVQYREAVAQLNFDLSKRVALWCPNKPLRE